jgi:hypothetical protein
MLSPNDPEWGWMAKDAHRAVRCTYCKAAPGNHCVTTLQRCEVADIPYTDGGVHWGRYRVLWDAYEAGLKARWNPPTPPPAERDETT